MNSPGIYFVMRSVDERSARDEESFLSLLATEAPKHLVVDDPETLRHIEFLSDEGAFLSGVAELVNDYSHDPQVTVELALALWLFNVKNFCLEDEPIVVFVPEDGRDLSELVEEQAARIRSWRFNESGDLKGILSRALLGNERQLATYSSASAEELFKPLGS
jgi:hypothetical protein